MKAAVFSVVLLCATLATARVTPLRYPLDTLSSRQGTCTSDMFNATAEQTEGPFYVATVARKDITSGRPGVPLTLRLAVKGRDCKPFPAGTVVSIWHAAVDGTYSGFLTRPNGEESRVVDARGSDYMRGEQATDVSGVAEFKTVVPGWYVGRPVHIHVKVLYSGGEFTTQLYFPEETIAVVTRNSAYRVRGAPRTSNEDEEVPAGLIQKPKQNADGSFTSEFTIGIDVDVSAVRPRPATAAARAPSKNSGDDCA